MIYNVMLSSTISYICIILLCCLLIGTSKKSVGLSTDFPSVDETLEFVKLCEMVYEVNDCSEVTAINCHWYKGLKDGTQLMVVSSNVTNYIAAIYAGTDNWKNVLTDIDIRMSYLGPENDPIDTSVRIHKGFNDAVFNEGLFDDILVTVSNFLVDHPSYKIITSGHSLGGAEAILTAVGLAHYFPDLEINSITFGTPRIGDRFWKSYSNSYTNLGIWRFVHRDDIVPRLPLSKKFEHCGHTLQLYITHVRAYYLHEGEKPLGYKGVPFTWEASAFKFIPGAIANHLMQFYVKYIKKKSRRNPTKYYPDHFAKDSFALAIQ